MAELLAQTTRTQWLPGRSLPLDNVAAKLGCIGGEPIEAEEAPLRVVEDTLTRERFTGLVCIDYETGDTLTLYLADGVALGAALDTATGELLGEDALDAAQHIPGPAAIWAAPLPLAEAEAYA